MEDRSSVTRLLTSHFLRRFLDNDLISPNADRHETLVVGATLLISFGLFATVILASKYVINPFPTPVHMALSALQDRVLYIGGSMLVLALVAVAQWEALSIDVRDAAILGPLPLDRATIVVAKLASLGIFAAAFALVLNVGPTVLFPLFFASQLPLSVSGIVTLLAAHALVTLLAGAFGAVSVVAVRELLRLLLGGALFQRVSTLVQAVLVVCGVTMLLLLPGFTSRLARAIDTPDPPVIAAPVLWFVGLHEMMVGPVLLNQPLPGRWVPRSIDERELRARAHYGQLQPRLRALAGRALPSLGLLSTVALLAFLWNNRHLPLSQSRRRQARPWWKRAAAALAERSFARASSVQAGFFFTLQVLPRSAPHRVAMATSAAAGLAAVTLAMGGIELKRVDPGSALLGSWAVQTLFITALLGGFRHALRVPAELRASNSFVMAWRGDEQGYLRGVKRAAIAALVLPTIGLFLPLHVLLFGPAMALLHAAFGVLFAAVLLECLCLGMRQPPFACGYVPTGSFKRAAPIYLAGVLIGCHLFAAIERAALRSGTGALVLFGLLAGAALALRWRDRALRRERVEIEIDEMPEALQRLGLSG